MMSMGALTSVITLITGKRKYKKDTKERIEKYKKYIEEKKEEFVKSRNEELLLLNEIYRDQRENLDAVLSFSGELFDRTKADEDFLFVKAGDGTCDAIRKIDYKKKESFSTDDELVSLPEMLSKEFQSIRNAPISVDLNAQNAIGVVGTWKALYDILKNFTVDICTRHYYKDVKAFYIIDERYAGIFNWLRFLPHLRNEQMNNRNIAYDIDSRVSMYEYLYKELSNRESSKGEYVSFVIFVFDSAGFKRHPVSKFVEKAAELKVAFIFFDREKEQLPLHCSQIIAVREDGGANILTCDDRNVNWDFSYSIVEDNTVEQMAIKLSPIYCEEVSLESSLTKNISLFELLRIFGVDDLDLNIRWKKSQVTKSMAAPLGVKTKKEVVSLDLHEKAHGPHGLIAGTTGSGKSEILQSYILSAATMFHPYDIAFVIIDFKGGGMVNQFKNLPHLVGAITNIDGKEINRSLLSIKAELTKRQSLFAEADVNHIDKYITKFKNGETTTALPHLVIIVDEFAELKAEQPEFMAELISAARIGRSLGVHLILATQKPAGQVNEQIWSNSRFKLCLKVQTQEDSNEVLKSPLAAEILEPGRAYFQVGNNEIFELFQSAYSGSPEKIDSVGGVVKKFYLAAVDLAGRREVVYAQKPADTDAESKTQLDAIVDYINQHCKQSNIEKLPDICLPPLPELIYFPDDKDMISKNNAMTIPLGIYDDPIRQYQGQAKIEIGLSNTVIIGSAQQGKTNLLQSIIRSLTSIYSPEEVNIYIIDFASMILKNFEGLNHVGGVVTSSEDEKLKNLFKLLNEEVVTRKTKFMKLGVSSFSAYKEAGQTDLPGLVLMIDNLTMLLELYMQNDDILLPLLREGISVGLSIVIANSGTTGVGYRYLSNFASRISLYNNDSGEYQNIFDYCRMQPDNNPGRTLIEIDKNIYEAQTYLAFEGEKEIDRVRSIKEYIESIHNKTQESRAKLIPEIPEVLSEEYLKQNFVMAGKPYVVPLGLEYENVEPFRINYSEISMLALIGDREDKSIFIRRLINQLMDSHAVTVAVIDDFKREFAEMSHSINYSILPDSIINMIDDWDKELEKRYDELIEGNSKALNEKPLLFMLINNNDAIDALGNNTEAFSKFGNIIGRYKALKVCFVFSNIANAPISYSANEVYKRIKDSYNFIYFGNLNEFKIFDPQYQLLKKFAKPLDAGDAYFVTENDVRKVKTVIR
jgi:S-DNA-T family DNA segregation ATPase FtsK/SpoIIIE